MNSSPSLRPVFWDQAGDHLASLNDLRPGCDVVLIAEAEAEATYVRHHKQKLVLMISALRQLAGRLTARGVQVIHHPLSERPTTLVGSCLEALARGDFERVVLTEPSDHRLRAEVEALRTASPVVVEVRRDDRFICPPGLFEDWARDRAELRMEFFYRVMRRRTGLLMDGDKPAGGRWNFDADNRRRLPADAKIPGRAGAPPNPITREVMNEVAERFSEHFGEVEGFDHPTNPVEAEAMLDAFIRLILPSFGDWQDAMAAGRPWLWHSRISAAMNIGLLDPLEACRRAEAAYRCGRAPLNAVEGFIRQILGWREFVRGVYHLKGPDYLRLNVLEARGRLPDFYWTGETSMACVADVVASVRDLAYAHHIQRLMVTGNLAMLLGVEPAAVNNWYMVGFADAHEWVEAPNTHGMAIFADGGVVGSKPYAGSGAYISRMSDYCTGCAHDPKQRHGAQACPFNALYWDFIDRHEDRFVGNPRMAMPVRGLRAMSAAERRLIAEQAGAWRRAFGVA